MTSEGFLQTFGHLLDAPNGVTKLRELILQLAVQGKLVEQDPDDEPAQNLFESIASQKQKLLSEGSVIKFPSVSDICLETRNKVLPEGWAISRLGELLISITGGGTPSKNNPSYWNGDIPWASVKDLKDSRYLEKTQDFITIDGLNNSSSNLIAKNSVIVCTRMGLGKIAINTLDVAINQDLKALQLFEEIEKDYFYIFYKTLEISGSGMTVSGIKQSELLNFIVPLPPLEEQKRIVKKVDELMTLVDRLEHAQTEKARTRSKLSKASFAALANAQNASEFTESWQRVSRHFSELVKTQEDLQTLRQTILQLAVQGKLTEQSAEDGDAREELEDISKTYKLFPRINPISEHVPFKLPKGWAWTRFPEIGEFGRGKSKHRPRNDPKLYNDGKYPLVQTGDVARSKGIIKTFTGMYNQVGLSQSRLWPKGTMCITIAANIADSGILSFEACFPDSIVGFIPHDRMRETTRYFEYFMRTAKANLQDYAPSTAQKNINLGILQDVLIPLPPLAEQKRIVAKVDSLMAVCDRLEALLSQQQSTAERLVGAVVQGLAA